MNFIVLMCDTFRRDHLGFHGNAEIRTPRLDAFAAESVVFDQAFSCSFPTLPCRAEIFSGRFVFPSLDWGPLPRSEVLLSETLARQYYNCAVIADNYQMMRPGYDFDRGFHSRLFIRGQGRDAFVSNDVEVELPCPAEKLKDPERMRQYYRNVSSRRGEEEYFAPMVMSRAMEWLEREHRRGKFFLWVDCFDPHEPWDPAPRFLELYEKDYAGDDIRQPHVRASRYTEEELVHIRNLYKGEVSMVDAWIGKLLDRVDELGLRNNTTIVFMSDHGIYVGDRGLIGKMDSKSERVSGILGWPPYTELSSVPMVWRVPGVAPGRRSCFIHPGDLSPTVLDLAGVQKPETFRTRSAERVIRGQEEKLRDVAVSSWPLKNVRNGRPSVVRNEEWTYVFWRADVEPELFHRPTDPLERTNVYRKHRAKGKEMHAAYLGFLREQEVLPSNLAPRMWTLPFTRAQQERPGGPVLAAG